MPYIIQYDFLRIILKIFLDKTTTLYFGLTVPPKMITLTILNLHYLNLLSHRLKLYNLDFCLYRIYMLFYHIVQIFCIMAPLSWFYHASCCSCVQCGPRASCFPMQFSFTSLRFSYIGHMSHFILSNINLYLVQIVLKIFFITCVMIQRQVKVFKYRGTSISSLLTLDASFFRLLKLYQNHDKIGANPWKVGVMTFTPMVLITLLIIPTWICKDNQITIFYLYL